MSRINNLRRAMLALLLALFIVPAYAGGHYTVSSSSHDEEQFEQKFAKDLRCANCRVT